MLTLGLSGPDISFRAAMTSSWLTCIRGSLAGLRLHAGENAIAAPAKATIAPCLVLE
jgi:hypothetical protein